MSEATRRRTIVPLGIAVAAGLLAIVIALSSGSGEGDETAGDKQNETGDLDARRPGAADSDAPGSDATSSQAAAHVVAGLRVDGDPRAVGAVDAPVVMVMYSDFQCQFCGRYATDTEPILMDTFVENGTLRIEWRDLPYLGEESMAAARAGHAAAEQDSFWELERHLFATQAPTNSGALTNEHLESIAGDLGLDVDRFRSDMATREVAEALHDDIEAAVGLGINGTPTFFINGQMLVGAQPTEVFLEAVENAAAAA